jgi:hypothetical protein
VAFIDTQDQLTLDVIVKVVTDELGRREGWLNLALSERILRRYLSENATCG